MEMNCSARVNGEKSLMFAVTGVTTRHSADSQRLLKCKKKPEQVSMRSPNEIWSTI